MPAALPLVEIAQAIEDLTVVGGQDYDFGVVAAEVESALKDGEIDRQESLRIDDALSSMEKKIWALRAKTQSGDRS